MITTGIIAEYNPCHLGHAYHIEETKKRTGSDCVVVIMSGNFVQRGDPAFADKYLRAQHAITCGADAVIELPVCYCASSAEIFAKGAVSILDKLCCIDNLSFGGETDDLSCLNEIAGILEEEPEKFQEVMAFYMKKGYSLPLARAHALDSLLDSDMTSKIISSPNNILALEYLRALRFFKSSIRPVVIKRQGNGYNDDSVNGRFLSASAIRKSFYEKKEEEVYKYLDSAVRDSLKCNFGQTLPVFQDDFSQMLNYALRLKKDELSDYVDMNEVLQNKVINQMMTGEILAVNELVLSLKTRDYTYSRLNRSLLHVLLDYKKTDFDRYIKDLYPGYIRVLGFNAKGRKFIKEVKKNSSLPVLENAKAKNVFLTEAQNYVLQKDVFAAEIYNDCVKFKYGNVITDEFRHRPVML